MHISIQHLQREALRFLEVLQMLNENIPFRSFFQNKGELILDAAAFFFSLFSIYLCVGITFTP